jgi:N-hydroxyarylamine O-acetyltransferase
MLQVFRNKRWMDLYSFDLEYVCQGDVEYGNYYTSSSPGSVFVKARVAALPLQDGFVTLFNNTVTKNSQGMETCIEVEEGEEYSKMLASTFGIHLDRPLPLKHKVPN